MNDDDDFDDEYCEAEFCRIRTRPGPHPDDNVNDDEDDEEQWLLDRIAEHEESEMYEAMAEEHMREMAAEDVRLADRKKSEKLNVKGETR